MSHNLYITRTKLDALKTKEILYGALITVENEDNSADITRYFIYLSGNYSPQDIETFDEKQFFQETYKSSRYSYDVQNIIDAILDGEEDIEIDGNSVSTQKVNEWIYELSEEKEANEE